MQSGGYGWTLAERIRVNEAVYQALREDGTRSLFMLQQKHSSIWKGAFSSRYRGAHCQHVHALITPAIAPALPYGMVMELDGVNQGVDPHVHAIQLVHS
jgi:hypothetical protein